MEPYIIIFFPGGRPAGKNGEDFLGRTFKKKIADAASRRCTVNPAEGYDDFRPGGTGGISADGAESGGFFCIQKIQCLKDIGIPEIQVTIGEPEED